jgi:hypothetical protein
MDKAEASATLAIEVQKLRKRPYCELVRRLLDKQETFEVTAASGVRYQIELQAFWDDKRAKNLRVIGAIDDGGWSFLSAADRRLHRRAGRVIRR